MQQIIFGKSRANAGRPGFGKSQAKGNQYPRKQGFASDGSQFTFKGPSLKSASASVSGAKNVVLDATSFAVCYPCWKVMLDNTLRMRNPVFLLLKVMLNQEFLPDLNGFITVVLMLSILMVSGRIVSLLFQRTLLLNSILLFVKSTST